MKYFLSKYLSFPAKDDSMNEDGGKRTDRSKFVTIIEIAENNISDALNELDEVRVFSLIYNSTKFPLTFYNAI